MKKLVIIGSLLAPCFNEALANQIRVLSNRFNLPVLTCNDIGNRIISKHDQYLIVNSKYLLKRTPVLSLINGLILLIIVKYYNYKYDLIIAPGGPNSEFIKYLNPKKCIPMITSITKEEEEDLEKYVQMLYKYHKIIVQSDKVKRKLEDLNFPDSRIKFLYPIINVSRFKSKKTLSLKEFRVLFASAPNVEYEFENNFYDKGVPFLLDAFKKVIEINPDFKLFLIWRGKYNAQLSQKIHELGIEQNIVIFDGYIDMPKIYQQIHLTVIPYINLHRSPELPSSAIESLLSGRPVLSTETSEICSIIKKFECGAVCSKEIDSLVNSLLKCKENYLLYQNNCENFSSFYSKYLEDELSSFKLE